MWSTMSDDYHTMQDLYHHRSMLTLALLNMAKLRGLEVGWSRRHSDGELCFGGGWVLVWLTTPSGLQMRYHMKDTYALFADSERDAAPVWNGDEETLHALAELAEMSTAH
jgi:hypothetical protein